MPFAESTPCSQLRNVKDFLHSAVPLRACVVASALIFGACSQQTNETTKQVVSDTPKAAASAPVTMLAGPRWRDLTDAQRLILQPLTTTWDSLDNTRKSKWIAIALSYSARNTAEQQRMQERMVEWAALTPAARERARLNFAGTKKLSPNERAADWETYQGLSTEEKKAFAKVGGEKPTGAAVAVIPLNVDKLTPVPVTRRTPANEDATVLARPSINPKTLLPSALSPAEAIAAPATVPTATPEAGASGSPLIDKSLTIN